MNNVGTNRRAGHERKPFNYDQPRIFDQLSSGAGASCRAGALHNLHGAAGQRAHQPTGAGCRRRGSRRRQPLTVWLASLAGAFGHPVAPRSLLWFLSLAISGNRPGPSRITGNTPSAVGTRRLLYARIGRRNCCAATENWVSGTSGFTAYSRTTWAP